MAAVRLYGLFNAAAASLATNKGRTIVHDNREELAYLFPYTRIVEVPSVDLASVVPIQHVPGMENVVFPLKKEDFK